jgi:hypothetical protein
VLGELEDVNRRRIANAATYQALNPAPVPPHQVSCSMRGNATLNASGISTSRLVCKVRCQRARAGKLGMQRCLTILSEPDGIPVSAGRKCGVDCDRQRQEVISGKVVSFCLNHNVLSRSNEVWVRWRNYLRGPALV